MTRGVPVVALKAGPLDQIHVWRFSLLQSDVVRESLFGTLNKAETARAHRMRFALHREQYVVGRGVLRSIIGNYIGLAPEAVEFEFGEYGKPSVRDAAGLQFNLSHSGNIGMLAVSYGRDIGIDIEYIDASVALAREREELFSPLETRALSKIDSAQIEIACLHTWVRKEAYLKALGKGLSAALDRFSVSVGAHVDPHLIFVDRELDQQPNRWQMYTIDVGADYAAALVVDGIGIKLRYFTWPSPSECQADSEISTNKGELYV